MTWRAAAVENHAKIYDLLKKEYTTNQINRNTKEYITNQISCNTKLEKVLIKDFLEQKSKTSETALHLACNSGAVELAQILLTDGASLELKDRRGNTPITLLLVLLLPSQKKFKLRTRNSKLEAVGWNSQSPRRVKEIHPIKKPLSPYPPIEALILRFRMCLDSKNMCIEEFLTISNSPSNYTYLKALLFLSILPNSRVINIDFSIRKIV